MKFTQKIKIMQDTLLNEIGSETYDREIIVKYVRKFIDDVKQLIKTSPKAEIYDDFINQLETYKSIRLKTEKFIIINDSDRKIICYFQEANDLRKIQNEVEDELGTVKVYYIPIDDSFYINFLLEKIFEELFMRFTTLYDVKEYSELKEQIFSTK